MTDATDTVILTVELASGRFRTELRVPLMGQPEEAKAVAMDRWLDFITTAFRIGAQEMSATWDPKAPAGATLRKAPRR